MGNQVKELTLEGKAKRSNIVIIGHIVSVSKLDCPDGYICADVAIDSVLKGKEKEKVRILFDGPIVEFNPLCCEEGSYYLFFLTKLKSNIYESANGPYGVYKLPKAQ